MSVTDCGRLRSFLLSKADSNHHKQNQNLLCYHYTIGQSCLLAGDKDGANRVQKASFLPRCSPSSQTNSKNSGAKVVVFYATTKYFSNYFTISR